MTDSQRKALILRVADAVGGLMEFWGFKRNMGRMWAVLYLESEPKSAADLGNLLSLSSGAISMTANELVMRGVIKKSWVPGQRRDYYEAETNIWKMVSRVLRERELQQIRAAIEVFDDAIQQLNSAEDADDAAKCSFAKDRVSGLISLARIGESLLTAILDGKSISSLPIRGFKLES